MILDHTLGHTVVMLEIPFPSADHLVPSAPMWVEVLVDCPGAQDIFTYRIPDRWLVQPGDILTVPFGAQQVGAIALSLLHHPPEHISSEKIRPIVEVVSRKFFSPHYWELLQQVAQYYCTPLMQVIRVALPPGLLGRSQRRIRLLPTPTPTPTSSLSPGAQKLLHLLQASKTGDYSWQYLQRQAQGAERSLRELVSQGWVESYLTTPEPTRPKLRQAVTLVERQDHPELTPRQHEALEFLKRQGGDVWLSDWLAAGNISSGIVKTLEGKGCLVITAREQLRQETGPKMAGDRPQELTPDQVKAVTAIGQLSGYAQVLLHGVTGSGKTEVYLQAIMPILQRGQSVLVLVPEIGLTPQLTDRFRNRFQYAGPRLPVLVYHSALSEGERYDTWRQTLLATPQIIIGTRSAIFAPLVNLGLIILDEEHDSSFKQDQPQPCYHSRTVAQWRAKLENCPLILGSATPSLETWMTGQQPSTPSLYLRLPQRVQARPLPPITVVDMRQELHQGNRSIFSRPLQQALQKIQTNGQQGILFIHRRGHSTFVSCRSCGYVIYCPDCDVSLSYHHTTAEAMPLLRCHYCNYHQSHPQHCPQCQSPYLKFFGSGTQRVTQELTRLFPDLRWIRFDSDTTQTKNAHRTLLTRFAAGEAQLLVGTQMLTKGIDLPQVTLVGVVSADGLLHMSDFRATERAWQTLTQVAGRSGRGEEPGQVIVQTYTPEHPVIQALQQPSEDFMQQELAQRQLLHYPPCGQLVLLRISGLEVEAVRSTAQKLADYLLANTSPDYQLLGPAPAAIERVARRYRWQILLKFPTVCHSSPPLTDKTWSELRSLCGKGVSLTIDVDPCHL